MAAFFVFMQRHGDDTHVGLGGRFMLRLCVMSTLQWLMRQRTRAIGRGQADGNRGERCRCLRVALLSLSPCDGTETGVGTMADGRVCCGEAARALMS